MPLEEYFGDWFPYIDVKTMNVALQNVSREAFYPKASDVFRAFRECSLKKCKVVFLGQDPYPQKDVATGLAFGNFADKTVLSPSLEVLKEAAINYELPHYGLHFDQTLCEWAHQGVLLLNSALTVRPNTPSSHSLLWRPFIMGFIKVLSRQHPEIMYVLFGRQAQSFKSVIDKSCVVMEREHPAALARKHEKLDYQLFVDINKYIKDIFKEEIKWFTDINDL